MGRCEGGLQRWSRGRCRCVVVCSPVWTWLQRSPFRVGVESSKSQGRRISAARLTICDDVTDSKRSMQALGCGSGPVLPIGKRSSIWNGICQCAQADDDLPSAPRWSLRLGLYPYLHWRHHRRSDIYHRAILPLRAVPVTVLIAVRSGVSKKKMYIM